MLAIGVAVAGAAGAACRYLVDGFVQNRVRGPFPMGTFVVNISGALLLGALTGFFLTHAGAPADLRTLTGTGFIGAYTTFSTLAYETLRLAEGGARWYALLNLLGSTAASLAAAGGGLWLGRHL
jgi:CrcB protein